MARSPEGELSGLLGRFRQDLAAVFRAAFDAARAPRLLDRALDRPEHAGLLENRAIVVVAAGKAAAPMASALARRYRGQIAGGLVVGTHAVTEPEPPLEWIAGGHPVPDVRSVEAGARALALARGARRDGVFVVLLSGGASALMALPRPGLSLADKQATTRRLLAAGADIRAMNAVRKHLSAIKGGQLAAAAAAPTLALVVSDVVGDDLGVIGSGPTVPDATSFADAWRVIEACGGPGLFPPATVGLLRLGMQGVERETPKPGDPGFTRVLSRVIGSRADAVDGAARAARSLGYRVTVLEEPVVGEARTAGPRLVERGRAIAALSPDPVCVIGAGETIVHVIGRGRGGRNQEVALSAAASLAALPVPAALLSGGTDGIDGPTDAAGAIADTFTLDRARRAGLPGPAACLDDNDAYSFFHALGDLVICGPTGTNVGDVQVLLCGGTASRPA